MSIGLGKSIKESVSKYLEVHANDIECGSCENPALYGLIMQEVKAGVLESVLIHTYGNQAKTARIMGLNRNTVATYIKSTKNK